MKFPFGLDQDDQPVYPGRRRASQPDVPADDSMNALNYDMRRSLGMSDMMPIDPGETYSDLTRSFNYKNGGKVSLDMLAKGGMIRGEGTGKSDSIPAELPVNGYVLPIEVVKAIGPENLQKMITEMSQDKVQARVSNGEFWIPPEIVKRTGAEFWDGLVEKYAGQAPKPDLAMKCGGKVEHYADGGMTQNLRQRAFDSFSNEPTGRNMMGYQPQNLQQRALATANMPQRTPSLSGVPRTDPAFSPKANDTFYRSPVPQSSAAGFANNMAIYDTARNMVGSPMYQQGLQNAQSSINDKVESWRKMNPSNEQSSFYGRTVPGLNAQPYKDGGMVRGYSEGGLLLGDRIKKIKEQADINKNIWQAEQPEIKQRTFSEFQQFPQDAPSYVRTDASNVDSRITPGERQHPSAPAAQPPGVQKIGDQWFSNESPEVKGGTPRIDLTGSRQSNPNIYGPGGVNLGANPAQAQMQTVMPWNSDTPVTRGNAGDGYRYTMNGKDITDRMTQDELDNMALNKQLITMKSHFIPEERGGTSWRSGRAGGSSEYATSGFNPTSVNLGKTGGLTQAEALNYALKQQEYGLAKQREEREMQKDQVDIGKTQADANRIKMDYEMSNRILTLRKALYDPNISIPLKIEALMELKAYPSVDITNLDIPSDVSRAYESWLKEKQ